MNRSIEWRRIGAWNRRFPFAVRSSRLLDRSEVDQMKLWCLALSSDRWTYNIAWDLAEYLDYSTPLPAAFAFTLKKDLAMFLLVSSGDP